MGIISSAATLLGTSVAAVVGGSIILVGVCGCLLYKYCTKTKTIEVAKTQSPVTKM
jgi:hypothetical protein